jgi:voltage-gated potassium channel
MRYYLRFLRVIYALLFIIAIGVIGYMIIERWSFVDALYMTVITISTVGYGEVHVLSAVGKAFSIVLIVAGVGVVMYTATMIVQYLIEGRFFNTRRRRRMQEKISKLKNHFILCGYGRVGREVAYVFEQEETPFIVIDVNDEAVSKANNDGYLYLQGNATSDEIIKEAGIDRAKGLIATMGSDADNIYVTLSAREMRPDIFIIARAFAEESESKLKRAGANRTILPQRLGGRRMAMLAIRPLVVDFIESAVQSRGREFVLENIKVGPSSPIVDITVKEALGCCGALAILLVKKKDGNLVPNPPDETLLEFEDELVIIGTREQLRTLEG